MSRVVLVTGCTAGGIGHALCEEFASQGCKVYATSRRIETMAEFQGTNISKLALDVTSDESVRKAIDHIVEQDGKIDVVVNNAGAIAAGPIVEYPLEGVRDVFEANTYAILRMCQAVVPIMAKCQTGTIVNIGSIVGEIATPWNGVYCASKAAVYSISETLSMELQPLGILVVHVAPGSVKSNIATNGLNRFSLAPNTLYGDFLSNILKRINASQGGNSMPREKFAKRVVSKVLGRKPPRYISLGGNAVTFYIFKWLPRSLVLYILWTYSKRP